MKKVIVVSKTHLDLGFTDYADNIKKRYITEFIPDAMELAAQVNSGSEKRFIWTTGSWILKEALNDSDSDRRRRLKAAIKNGDIAAHALPFTMHTELLDEDTLDYGLSIIDKIDELRGKKTVAAKMTDVPGHTKGLVKMLARHGIKLLHIGVNGASSLPDVPECFLWKNGDAEVVTIYSGNYGGAFQSELTEEILYLDHTVDNRGVPSKEKFLKRFAELKKQYKDYTICAGTLDDYAELIWEHRHKLPVFEGEIGDTWIHGSASDPYKSAALRELIQCKRNWLADGSMQKGSAEYTNVSDALLCTAEHTCGMDSKMFLADYEHYLKADFQKARARDTVRMLHPFRDYPQNFSVAFKRRKGEYKRGSYRATEKSWEEQRSYLKKAVAALSPQHKAEAEKKLAKLRPQTPQTAEESKPYSGPVKSGDWELSINEYGGIEFLSFHGNAVIRHNNRPVLEYRSYGKADYDYWLEHYSRNLKETAIWALGDFSRPLLKYAEGKYPCGKFFYHAESIRLKEETEQIRLFVTLTCDNLICDKLGAPRRFQIVYTLHKEGLNIHVAWFGKDANRLTEAIFLHLYPEDGSLTLQKICDFIKPEDVVSKGSRNLHAVRMARLQTEHGSYQFINHHSPLISVGPGKILEFDNAFESMEQDGISYVLYDNVWGTNFPLWYEENAGFSFSIKAET
ncbi:MAG: DUF5054 domain-containing protein [Lachnospiraceae bacterium]